MHRKHMLWMILCCAVPLAGLALLSLLGASLQGGLLPLLIVLLCPLSHLLMMRGMSGSDHRHESAAGDGRERAAGREQPARVHQPAGSPRGMVQALRRKLTKLGI